MADVLIYFQAIKLKKFKDFPVVIYSKYNILEFLKTIINKEASIILKTQMTPTAGLTGFQSMENSRGTETSPRIIFIQS